MKISNKLIIGILILFSSWIWVISVKHSIESMATMENMPIPCATASGPDGWCNDNIPPLRYNKGYSTWKYPYNIGLDIFAKRQNSQINNYVKYTNNYTMSGEFVTTMPPAYNY